MEKARCEFRPPASHRISVCECLHRRRRVVVVVVGSGSAMVDIPYVSPARCSLQE